jgi:hypothetical protein
MEDTDGRLRRDERVTVVFKLGRGTPSPPAHHVPTTRAAGIIH